MKKLVVLLVVIILIAVSYNAYKKYEKHVNEDKITAMKDSLNFDLNFKKSTTYEYSLNKRISDTISKTKGQR